MRFLKDISGASMVEYGLLAALIAAVAVGAVGTLGRTVDGKFDDLATAINGA